MKYFNICTKKTWEQNGEEKTKWLVCGTKRVTDDGKEFIEMNDKPDTIFYIFEQKPRENKPQGGTGGSGESGW